MHPEENRLLSQKPQFGGSVEVISPTPLMIEFAGKGRVWAFPIHALCCFDLEAIPDNPERKRMLPPSEELRVHPFDEGNSTTPQPTSPLEN